MLSGKKGKSLKNKYSSFFSNGRDVPEPEPEPDPELEPEPEPEPEPVPEPEPEPELEPEPEPEPENSMEGICPLLREFKDSQEVELVIERVPPRDKEDLSEYTE